MALAQANDEGHRKWSGIDQHLPELRHLLDMTGFAPDTTMAMTTVRQAAAGDTASFARIVAAYHADLMRVAYVISAGDQDLAADAVQAAWLVAWRKLGSLRDPDRLKPWLVAVAANEARQLCRRRRRETVVEIDLGMADPGEPDPAERADALDLEGALLHLSADERALLALRYEAGLDSREIGSLVGRPAATIRWRLARLIGRLRKELCDA
jgi:RNA polymerase sigma-70 factor (ECF subfamily)